MNYKEKEIRAILDCPVVLIGMMGSGKTHIGRLLAKELELEFFDSDKIIEERAGCSVAEIFERDGEQKFREAEAMTIGKLIDNKIPCVIATGGGAVMNPQTLQKIKTQTVSIWIYADTQVMLERVSRNENRPLLACENPQERLEHLMHERRSLYEQAAIHIDSAESEPFRVLKTMIDMIYNYIRK